MAPNVLVDDRDCPYQTEDGSQFLWFRARQPGDEAQDDLVRHAVHAPPAREAAQEGRVAHDGQAELVVLSDRPHRVEALEARLK